MVNNQNPNNFKRPPIRPNPMLGRQKPQNIPPRPYRAKPVQNSNAQQGPSAQEMFTSLNQAYNNMVNNLQFMNALSIVNGIYQNANNQKMYQNPYMPPFGQMPPFEQAPNYDMMQQFEQMQAQANNQQGFMQNLQDEKSKQEFFEEFYTYLTSRMAKENLGVKPKVEEKVEPKAEVVEEPVEKDTRYAVQQAKEQNMSLVDYLNKETVEDDFNMFEPVDIAPVEIIAPVLDRDVQKDEMFDEGALTDVQEFDMEELKTVLKDYEESLKQEVQEPVEEKPVENVEEESGEQEIIIEEEPEVKEQIEEQKPEIEEQVEQETEVGEVLEEKAEEQGESETQVEEQIVEEEPIQEETIIVEEDKPNEEDVNNSKEEQVVEEQIAEEEQVEEKGESEEQVEEQIAEEEATKEEIAEEEKVEDKETNNEIQQIEEELKALEQSLAQEEALQEEIHEELNGQEIFGDESVVSADVNEQENDGQSEYYTDEIPEEVDFDEEDEVEQEDSNDSQIENENEENDEEFENVDAELEDDLEGESQEEFGNIIVEEDGDKSINRSMTEKILNAEPDVMETYNEIKNTLLSYRGIKSRFSSACESYRLSRKLVAKFVIIGRTMKLYLALNPDEFPNNIYHQKNEQKKKAYIDVPFMVKVKSKLSIKKAKELIDKMMRAEGIKRNFKYQRVDYVEQLKNNQVEEE